MTHGIVTEPIHGSFAKADVAAIAARLTERDCEALNDIWHASEGDRWLRPMDCGAFDGSDHSYRLKRLAGFGLVDRQRRNSIANEYRSGRGSYVYRILPLGLAVRSTLSRPSLAGASAS